MTAVYQKTGYLNSDFKLFHITDSSTRTFDFHYHDFHKILIFLRGNVSYIVEGKQYALQPQDILMVHAGEIHRPIVHDDTEYERIIVYVSTSFFDQLLADGADLFRCFRENHARGLGLFRLGGAAGSPLPPLFEDLRQSARAKEYAYALYQRIKFIEFLIVLNRLTDGRPSLQANAITANPVVQNILKYINDHLGDEDLSVDTIAAAAYLNRSYLMHLFKAETGYTVGRYIADKRLFLARSCLSAGMSVTEACFRSGFKNYTSFYYAHKKKYGFAPGKGVKPYFPEKSSE